MQGEREYRRGFHHGFLEALEAIEDLEDAKANGIKARLDHHAEKLFKWRIGDCSKIVIAPSVELPKKEKT